MPTRATSGKVARAGTLRSLAGEIGDWSGDGGPLHRQLAIAIARAVERGAVAHGSRLPAERTLAAALSVSRGTAVAAYDLLIADGLVERHRGSGTFAIGPGTLALPAGREGSALVARLVRPERGPDRRGRPVGRLGSARRARAGRAAGDRLGHPGSELPPRHPVDPRLVRARSGSPGTGAHKAD